MSAEHRQVPLDRSGSERSDELQRHPHPFGVMERLFEQVMRRHMFVPSWLPQVPFFSGADIAIDMFEEGDDLVIKAELPGMKRETIGIDISGDIVTISGEKGGGERTDGKDYYRVERTFGHFSRKLQLPVKVRGEMTRASFSDGLLEIRMPKSEAGSRKVQRITID